VRLSVMDARTEWTLVEQPVDASAEKELLSAIVFRVLGPPEQRTVRAIGLYAIQGKSMTLVSASWNPDADIPVDPNDFAPGFPDFGFASDMKPGDASMVLLCWSQNGDGSGGLASVLFEKGNADGYMWHGTGVAPNFDRLLKLELKKWPKPAWLLVAWRG
jgi:hypothetical protein